MAMAATLGQRELAVRLRHVLSLDITVAGFLPGGLEPSRDLVSSGYAPCDIREEVHKQMGRSVYGRGYMKE